MSLGLDQPYSISTEPVPPPHKSAGLAFSLSLLVPGAGQMYCGKIARGGVTLAFFVLSLVFSVVGISVPDAVGQEIVGIAMIAVFVLYIFSFLDAYYVAREINAGTDALIDSNNPRVATTLNLLTNGFGYWYLGERNKGWIAFVVLGIAMRGISRAMGDSPWSVLLLLIPCAMALDAHRIARRQVAEALSGISASPSLDGSKIETRLPAAVPITFALFLVVAFVGLLGLGMMTQKSAQIDQSRAVVDQATNPRRYENPVDGIRLLAPDGWSLYPSKKGYMISARKEQGCQVMLVREPTNPFRSLPAIMGSFSQDLLQKNVNFRKVAERPGNLGNLTGQEVEFVATFHGNEVVQRYLMARKGFVLYSLVTTMASPLQQECEPDANWIRENLTIEK